MRQYGRQHEPGSYLAWAAAAANPPNPVPILRETGAVPVPGTATGSYDIYGDRYADGKLYGPGCTAADHCGEQVTVTTVVSGTLVQVMAQNLGARPSDSNAVITAGTDWFISVTPVVSFSDGYQWFVSPAMIAARMHGYVVAVR